MNTSNFVYDIPTKVYFGAGQWENLKTEIGKYGTKVLLVYGGGSIKKSGLYDDVINAATEAGVSVTELSGIEPNPKIDKVRRGVEICKEEGITTLLAVGGGSVIDSAKFIAAGACCDCDPWGLLTAKTRATEALPVIAIPTIAATGSEMNYSGVISNPETKQKLARGYNCMKPRAAFLKPELTYTVNGFQTACGSVDIFAHVVEIYFNVNDDLYLLDRVMESIMRTALEFGCVAVEEPENYEARANLMWASSWAINGFINGGRRQSWSCHPIEHELSAFYDITHGLGMAILMPRWLRYCLREDTLSRYVSFGRNVMGFGADLSDEEVASKSIDYLEDYFFNRLGLTKNLSSLGIGDEYFEEIASRVCVSNGYLNGFVKLDKNDVVQILNDCL